MKIVEHRQREFVISTDKSRLDIGVIHEFLSKSAYWAIGRPLDVVKASIEHSLCFGVYDQDSQIGFARVITDYSTFAWLCDVFILDSHRNLGLGKWLVECIIAHPQLQNIRRILLATKDAHELYRRWGGFENLQSPERWMEKFNPNL
jgi:GNAT superfamily N-acetyltransferase